MMIGDVECTPVMCVPHVDEEESEHRLVLIEYVHNRLHSMYGGHDELKRELGGCAMKFSEEPCPGCGEYLITWGTLYENGHLEDCPCVSS